ncbi:MAG: hypothetical protein GF331_20205, partial [Chitinivibrionales bacterium]|nr:hypothetical protein [Chitinivibrionales bacterium]
MNSLLPMSRTFQSSDCTHNINCRRHQQRSLEGPNAPITGRVCGRPPAQRPGPTAARGLCTMLSVRVRFPNRVGKRMGTFRDELLRIQRQNYRRMLRRISDELAPQPALARYEREYRRGLRTYRSLSNTHELLRSIVTSDIVFHGDYHTLRQSQRAVLYVLRRVARKRRTVLCLEMFYSSDQALLDRYQAGALGEKRFLRAIDYVHTWAFKWHHWKPILSFCREQGIPVRGHNVKSPDGRPTLRKRDTHSARIIADAVEEHPGALVYVVDGDYHIAPCHLPDRVERELRKRGRSARRTIVYQNVDRLYWMLAQDGKEEADVLRIGDDAFCLINTTPINKLQSYVNWLEFAGDAYYPVNSRWEELTDTNDTTTIASLVRTLCEIMEIHYPSEALERLSVYYANNHDFLQIVAESPQLRPLLSSIKRKIRQGEGFLIEYGQVEAPMFVIYLASSSLSMAAEEAMHLLHAARRDRGGPQGSSFDRFYALVL